MKAPFTGSVREYVAKRKNLCAACCNPIAKGDKVFRAGVAGWNPNYEGNDGKGCCVVVCEGCGNDLRSGTVMVVRHR